MMKLNRILSAAVAMAMSFTMFAGAVNLDTAADAPETETRTSTATIITADGVTYKEFEYTLPVDADDEEAEEIILQAAEEAAAIAPVSRATSYRDSVGRVNSFPLYSSRNTSFTCDPLWDDGGFLEVLVDRVTDANYLTISCDGAKYYDVDIQNNGGVVFYDGRSYGGTTCSLIGGDRPVLTFRADQNSTCRLRVFQNY